MAVFGAPLAHGDDAERAVRAGLRVLGAVDGLRGQRRRGSRARGGEHGRGARHAWVGPRPERRSRSATSSTPPPGCRRRRRRAGSSWAGRRSARRATRSSTRPLPPVDAKGKAEPVEAWLAVRPLVEPAERPARLGPFVGRARELDVVRSVWRQAIHERRPQLVTVVGPPGIGKSRLVREDGGRDPGGGRSRPARPLRAVRGAHRLPRVRPARPAGVRHLRLGPRAGRPGEARRGRRSAPAAGRGGGHDALPRAPPRARHGRPGRRPSASSSSPLRRVLERLGAERPVLVVYEDIHWAAASELDLIEYLGGQLRETGCAVMALTRPELLDERPWGARLPAHTSLVLGPLAAAEVEAMARARRRTRRRTTSSTGSSSAPRATRSSSRSSRPALADGTAAGALPVTVTAAIDARLDALPAALRSHVLVAAVVGRTFWRGVARGGHGRRRPRRGARRARAPRPRPARADEPARRRRGVPVPPRPDPRRRLRDAHPHRARGTARRTSPRTSRGAPRATPARSPGCSLTTGARRASRAARCRTSSPPRRSRSAAGRRGRWSSSTRWPPSSPTTSEARASIRLRRGIALKALDADHEAAAELAAVVPALEGTERLDALLYAGRAEVWCERHDEALGMRGAGARVRGGARRPGRARRSARAPERRPRDAR